MITVGKPGKINQGKVIHMKNFDTIIDDVRVNAKAAATVVSKQAAKIYDASKHRISAEAIKRSIGRKLIELGKLTYKATTQEGDYSEQIAKIVEEITELKQNLAIVNEHIASIKNQKICPECDNKVTKESAFCNVCGYKFEEMPAEDPVEAPVEETKEEAPAQEEAPVAHPDDIVVAAQAAVEEISQDAEEAVKAADEAVAAEAAEVADAVEEAVKGSAEEAAE